ncbi:zinc ribbon domain-containing protein [Thioalkalicoccus limnaeus]|uniref:Zinc ribbon domain-containing protein n=1 Tax=Thioalkalicoccus limnaeus TaxID=120681 RepID=A0ABV4BE91_9GAMM
MPFYEYQCEACGHELEVMQKIKDAPLVDCPQCQQPTLRRRISPVGFRLKGGGWYETDFKSGKKKNLHEGGDKKEPAASEKTDGGKKEAAPKKADAPAPASS